MKRMLLVIVGVFLFGVANANVSARVDINTANAQQLATLKGIGPKKAAVIVADRKHHGLFHSLNELTRIKGIGKAFLQRLLKRNPGRISLKK